MFLNYGPICVTAIWHLKYAFPILKTEREITFQIVPNWPFPQNFLLRRFVEKFPLSFSHGKEFSP